MEALERNLPNWIDAFLKYTENSEPPYLFRKWTAISCIAAAMQRKCYINWGTALTFYPNLYIVLVGPSATGKGTAMNPGLDILKEISTIRLSAQATTYQALITALKETNLGDIDMATGASVGHSSMTIFSKEFTVFLGYHNNELMAALCEWYDCDDDWSYRTQARGKEYIKGVWVNLIGGTTPDLIRSSLPSDSIGGGLTSRIIFIVEEKKAKLVTMPVQTPAELKLREALIEDLEKISLLSGRYDFTEGFAELWTEWCYDAEEHPPFYNPKFDGYIGRRRPHLMKLSMIYSAARGTNDFLLTRDDLEDSIKTLEEAEMKMEGVFAGVGKSDIASMIHRATAFLINYGSDRIPFFEFARYFSGDMDKREMDRVLLTLEASKIITQVSVPGKDGDDYILVNKDAC
jgi:hypothetical protein